MLQLVVRTLHFILVWYFTCNAWDNVQWQVLAGLWLTAYRLQEVKIFDTTCLNKLLLSGKTYIHPSISSTSNKWSDYQCKVHCRAYLTTSVGFHTKQELSEQGITTANESDFCVMLPSVTSWFFSVPSSKVMTVRHRRQRPVSTHWNIFTQTSCHLTV
jgi:hypothetical protein